MHQSFDEHLTHDAFAARSKRRPDIHLLSTGCRARQKQRGQIGARDQQDQDHGG